MEQRIAIHMAIHFIRAGIALPKILSIFGWKPALSDRLFPWVAHPRFGDFLWGECPVNFVEWWRTNRQDRACNKVWRAGCFLENLHCAESRPRICLRTRVLGHGVAQRLDRDVHPSVLAVVVIILDKALRQIPTLLEHRWADKSRFADVPLAQHAKEVISLRFKRHFLAANRIHAARRRDPCRAIRRDSHAPRIIGEQPSPRVTQPETVAIKADHTNATW